MGNEVLWLLEDAYPRYLRIKDICRYTGLPRIDVCIALDALRDRREVKPSGNGGYMAKTPPVRPEPPVSLESVLHVLSRGRRQRYMLQNWFPDEPFALTAVLERLETMHLIRWEREWWCLVDLTTLGR